jgi:hypothetical protein
MDRLLGGFFDNTIDEVKESFSIVRDQHSWLRDVHYIVKQPYLSGTWPLRDIFFGKKVTCEPGNYYPAWDIVRCLAMHARLCIQHQLNWAPAGTCQAQNSAGRAMRNLTKADRRYLISVCTEILSMRQGAPTTLSNASLVHCTSVADLLAEATLLIDEVGSNVVEHGVEANIRDVTGSSLELLLPDPASNGARTFKRSTPTIFSLFQKPAYVRRDEREVQKLTE